MIALLYLRDEVEEFGVVYAIITPKIVRLHTKERTFFYRERPTEYGGNFWFEFETNLMVKEISICQD